MYEIKRVLLLRGHTQIKKISSKIVFDACLYLTKKIVRLENFLFTLTDGRKTLNFAHIGMKILTDLYNVEIRFIFFLNGSKR